MLDIIKAWFCPVPRERLLQADRDEAEINAVCWAIRLKHRERDLQAAAVKDGKNLSFAPQAAPRVAKNA